MKLDQVVAAFRQDLAKVMDGKVGGPSVEADVYHVWREPVSSSDWRVVVMLFGSKRSQTRLQEQLAFALADRNLVVKVLNPGTRMIKLIGTPHDAARPGRT